MKLYLPRPFLTVVLVTVAMCSFFVGVVFAADYLGTGYFPTSNLNRCHVGSYYPTQAQYASGTWSSTTDLSMYYNCSSTHIQTEGLNFGATGWAGYAYICDTSWNCDNSTAYNSTYGKCYAKFNEYYLRNNDNDSIKWVGLHELGHCYSLGHRSDSTSVMNQAGTTVLQPNQTDRSLVNARY